MTADIDDLQPAAVLFSGGRHSSLAACLLATSGRPVDLLTTHNGAVIADDVVKYRVRELQGRFSSIRKHVTRTTFGLFRRIGIDGIERDFATYRYNLVRMADSLASHTEAILYCRQEGIPILASGFIGYEGGYPEHTRAGIEAMGEFVERYGIRYERPAVQYATIDDVKSTLLNFGVSTKSLEGCSLFDECLSSADAAAVRNYIEAKLPACEDYLRERGIG